MPATPQLTIRLDKVRLERWQDACERAGTNVSEQLRRLMERWITEQEEANQTLGI